MSTHLPHCLDILGRSIAPRRMVSVSAWADDHRYLSGKQSGERGRWRTSRTPFLREIMDALSEQSRVSDIVVMKSSQVGVTEATVNWLGYIMEHAPRPTMVLMPTLESRDTWKAQKLNPLLQETPIVRDLLGGVRSRDAANRQDMIDFPGGVLFLAGGNSPNSYAQKSVCNLIMDDFDRFPDEIGDEGDVTTLAKGRTKAFPRAKRVYISTPTVHEQSLIERQWERSDKRRYHLECPHCGEWQPLEWGADEPHGITWSSVQHEDGSKHINQAWYVCRACHESIHEHQKPGLLASGRWIPEHPGRAMRGYHLNALLAPIGLGPSWLDLARDWQEAIKSPQALQAFVNTNLGEPWVEKGEEVDATGLLARREEYPGDLDPLAITAGVDVQKDRLEVSVYGWGLGEECWAMDHIILPGNTAYEDDPVWDDLEDELADLVDAAVIDAGYNTDQVHKFCEGKPWTYPGKGVDGPGRPLVEDKEARRRRLRKRRRRKGMRSEPLGVDQGKTILYGCLKIEEPGPGYIHFPARPVFDDEFFEQLTAWKRVTRIRGTRPVGVWVQKKARDEAMDCHIYARAALRLAEIDLEARERRRNAPEKDTPSPEENPLIAKAAKKRRRGGYVGGWK